MKRLLCMALVSLVAGCGQREREFVGEAPMVVTANDRVSIERIAIVPDEVAYRGYRGVYIIRDKKTGQEFVGVSGVGISELGSHMSGKVNYQDER